VETKYKQRLIGVIVLAASAIIIIPALFKSSDNSATTPSVVITEQTPPAPVKPSAQVTVQQSNQAITTVRTEDNTAPPAEPVAQTNPHSTAQNVFSTSTPTTSATQQTPPPAVAVDNQATQNVPVANITTKRISAAEQTSLDETVDQTAKPQNKKVVAKIQDQNDTQSSDDVTTNVEKSNNVAAVRKVSQPQNSAKEKIAALEAQSLASETTTANQKSSAVKTAVTEEPTTVTVPDGSAWVVQLGSFSNLNNAKALEQKLQAKGFNAYLQKAKTAHGAMTKVLIGPETQKSKAQEILSKLKQEMDLKGVIVPYVPV
jgi:cell division septation protein DedD